MSDSVQSADFYKINQTSRAVRAGNAIKDTTISRQVNRSTYLGDFAPRNDYNPRKVVADLGSRFTQDFFGGDGGNTDRVRDANTEINAVSKKLAQKLVFTGYRDGGDLIGALSDAGVSTNGSTRTTTGLGLALGERHVLNPQPQFNKHDDPRTNPYRCKIGRVYAEQIMNNWPVSIWEPGNIKYRLGFFKLMGIGGGAGENESLIRNSDAGVGVMRVLKKVLTLAVFALSVPVYAAGKLMGAGKIVSFVPAPRLFNKYMSGSLNMLAANMGLLVQGGRGNGPKFLYNYNGAIPDLNWFDTLPAINMNQDQYLRFICLRCSNDIECTETFNNEIRQNPLMEQLNAASQESEDEANSGNTGLNIIKSAISGASSGAQSGGIKGGIFGGITGLGKGLLGSFDMMSFLGNFSEQALVMSGKARITLPQVWSESSFTRTINFNFKFHSPYGNKLSIFENTYYPFLFLFNCATPRQTGKLSYVSPFYVRIGMRSRFQLDYGIITNLQVTRGGEINDWTPDGFPKTLNVSVSVQDMTPNVTLSLGTTGIIKGALETMFPTSGMAEYFQSLGGLSMTDMSIKNRFKRTIEFTGSRFNAKFKLSNLTANFWNNKIVYSIWSLFNAVDVDELHRDPGSGLSTNSAIKRDSGTADKIDDNVYNFTNQTTSDFEKEKLLQLGPSFLRDGPNNYALSAITENIDRRYQTIKNKTVSKN